jgi:hypothetical protein
MSKQNALCFGFLLSRVLGIWAQRLEIICKQSIYLTGLRKHTKTTFCTRFYLTVQESSKNPT